MTEGWLNSIINFILILVMTLSSSAEELSLRKTILKLLKNGCAKKYPQLPFVKLTCGD